MKDHDREVLSIGGSHPSKPQSITARTGGSERPCADRDLVATVEELRRLNADLERQNRELRREQLELASSRDRYWDMWAHAPVGCLTVDREGLVLDANLAASVMLGAARPRLLGRALAEWLLDEDADALFRARKAAVMHANTPPFRARLSRPDGESLPVIVRSVAIRGEQGRTEWLTVLIEERAF